MIDPETVVRGLLVVLFTVTGIEIGMAFLMRAQRETSVADE